jgi:ATP-dependent Clp protease ATP-binding subunit ClpC
MFERYTEKARRVIFFARYEASQYGSPFIENAHLLLGVLREDTRFVSTLPAGATESVRKQIEERAPACPKIATSVDLPLSNAAKRVLVYAADEADRLHHRHIGCEHMVLGLLHETDSLAAKILEHLGVKAKQVRSFAQTVADDLSQTGRVLPPSYQGRARRSSNLIKLRDGVWDADYVREAVRRCCEARFHWQKAPWKPRDAVVERKTGKISLDLTLAEDAANFELVKGGWKRDLCAICRWELFESQDDHGTGHTNGRDWLCTQCYDKFWGRPDFIAGSFADMT